MLFTLYRLVVGGWRSDQSTPWQTGEQKWTQITSICQVKSDLRPVGLLALLSNLTDLKCDVWENAVATWSPDLLLIRPIRGETDGTPETGRDVLLAPGSGSPQTSLAFLNLAQYWQELGTV